MDGRKSRMRIRKKVTIVEGDTNMNEEERLVDE